MTVSPEDFARIIAMSAVLRHDLPEYLGARPATEAGIDHLLSGFSARPAALEGAATPAAA